MKNVMCAACYLLFSFFVFSQTGNSQTATVGAELESQLKTVEATFVPAVEAMPEDKMGFAPSSGKYEGVRTFGQLVKHTAAANYRFCSTILGEKPPVEIGGGNGPDKITSKTEIVKFDRDSLAYCHKAYASVTEKNMLEPVKSAVGPSQMTNRLGLAIFNLTHNMDEYGQIVEYLRMNGLVPPASDRTAAKPAPK